MRDVKTIIGIKIAVYALWPFSAMAAQATFGAAIVTMSLLSISVTMLISTLSGLTALLRQMKKDLERSGEIANLWLYVSSNLLASNTVGLLALFLSDGRLDHNFQAGVIIVASYGGTLVLDRSLQTLLTIAEAFFKKGRE